MEYATSQSKFFDGKHAVLVTPQAALHVEIKRHKKQVNGEWLIVVETKPFAKATNGKKQADSKKAPDQRIMEGL